MNLLGSTKNKLAKDKNGENVHHAEVTKFIVTLSTIVINKIQESGIHLFRIYHLTDYF